MLVIVDGLVLVVTNVFQSTPTAVQTGLAENPFSTTPIDAEFMFNQHAEIIFGIPSATGLISRRKTGIKVDENILMKSDYFSDSQGGEQGRSSFGITTVNSGSSSRRAASWRAGACA